MPARSTPFRVLLVDDGLKLAGTARALFEAPELQAVGPNCTFEDMADQVRAHLPDIVVMDLSGNQDVAFGAIEEVMAHHPTPILVLHEAGDGALKPFLALDLGALDVAERPPHPPPQFWRELSRKVVLLSQVRVVKHVRGRRRAPRKAEEPLTGPGYPLVAIAASLGGPKALSTLLSMLPREFKAPIVLVQHISDGFTGGMAHWLSWQTSSRVVEATDGEQLAPGTVYVGPSGFHLTVRNDGRIKLEDTPPLMGFRPACDRLLESAAAAFGRRAIGVVLTGMGRDGARGLKLIREAGGHTVAQDESSCVVFGMPREAIALGAAEKILPLDQIAAQLVRWVD